MTHPDCVFAANGRCMTCGKSRDYIQLHPDECRRAQQPEVDPPPPPTPEASADDPA